MKYYFIILLISFFVIADKSCKAQSVEDKGINANTSVPFTLADRDRILKLENSIDILNERIVSLESLIDKRFDSQQNQLNLLFGFMFLILGAVMSLIGFIIYDRRTILHPVTKKQKELEDILIDYSKKNNELKEILKKAGVL